MRTWSNKEYYKRNLLLATPIMLSSFGQNCVQMVDTLMVARLGTTELAAISFASALTSNILMVIMGISMGLTPLVGQNYAKKANKNLSLLLENSLLLNIIIAIGLVTLVFILMPLLSHIGEPADVIEVAKPYLVIVILSFLPLSVFITFKQWLEGMDNTAAAMIITLSTNLLNILLNYVFIFGAWGLPAMGVFGAGLSTFIARLISAIAFIIYVLVKKKYNIYLKAFSLSGIAKHMQARLLRIGLPIAGQMFIEMFALFGITIMMGWISKVHMAAFQIVNTMISTTFLTASGVCAATTVLISHAWGMEQREEIRTNYFCGWKMVLIMMSTFAIIFITLGKYVAMLFTSDVAVIEVAAQLFIVAGIFQIFDGTQISGLSALRGINDVAKPMGYAVISYGLVAVPMAYVCGFVLNLGAQSILAGFMLGLITAGILYHTRFHRALQRHFDRK